MPTKIEANQAIIFYDVKKCLNEEPSVVKARRELLAEYLQAHATVDQLSESCFYITPKTGLKAIYDGVLKIVHQNDHVHFVHAPDHSFLTIAAAK
jgi:hypothetical protein